MPQSFSRKQVVTESQLWALLSKLMRASDSDDRVLQVFSSHRWPAFAHSESSKGREASWWASCMAVAILGMSLWCDAELRPHAASIQWVWRCNLFFCPLLFRTLVAGGMGALMLDGYGWESMFYTTGVLSGLWALVVWQCFLKGTRVFCLWKSL